MSTVLEDKGMSTAKKNTQYINAKRRGFMQGAAVATGTVASGASLAATDASMDAMPVEPVEPKAKGYQRTEHVERYYQRARF